MELKMTDRKQKFLKNKIYKISNGLHLIINIINYYYDYDKSKRNWKESIKQIKEAFEYSHFDVKVYNHLNDEQVIGLINKQVNKDECKDYDAFFTFLYVIK